MGAMIQRCTNPQNPRYKNYGGRGITVCERWKDFRNFLSDMGVCPEGYSIERNDVNSGYSPENCIYIPRELQAANTTRARKVLFEQTQYSTIRNACRALNVKYKSVEKVMRKYKLSPEAAIQYCINRGLGQIVEPVAF